MNAIRDEIRIHATAGQVYDALSRQAGYRGWWNAVGEVAESVGGEAKLRFLIGSLKSYVETGTGQPW